MAYLLAGHPGGGETGLRAVITAETHGNVE